MIVSHSVIFAALTAHDHHECIIASFHLVSDELSIMSNSVMMHS